eukprot:tig00000630_g2690.t1
MSRCWLLVGALLIASVASAFVVCPDQKSACPDQTTCCELEKKGTFGCCPAPDAICCPDHLHCCPNGYQCGSTASSCLLPGANVEMSAMVKFAATPTIECPDKRTICPEGSTCCPLAPEPKPSPGAKPAPEPKEKYGCCPSPKAECCADKNHCCPEGMKCDATSTGCVPSNLLAQLVAKFGFPSLVNTMAAVDFEASR